MEHICPYCQFKSKVPPKLIWLEFVCPQCHTLVNSKNERLTVFEKYNIVSKKFAFELFETVTLENKPYQLVAIAIKQVDYLNLWTEYSFAYNNTFIYLSECNGHWIKLTETSKKLNLFKLRSKTSLKSEIYFNGRPYDIYSKDYIEVKYAIGFFNHIGVGKRYELAEYINPPLIVSAEFRNRDYTLFNGNHIDKKFLLDVKPSINLPAKVGVGIVEPSKFDFFKNINVFIYFTFLILLTYLANMLLSTNRHVFDIDMTIVGDSVNEVRSNSFELKGTSAPLTFEISSDNYNSWTSTSVELVNEKTNESLYANMDMEFYSGYEDGESWSEGDKNKEFSICGVPEGTYHLVISNQKDVSDTSWHSVQVKVNWHKPSFWNTGMALLFIFLVGLLHYFISHYHNRNRWSSSDYDIYYTEDEY